MIEGQFVEIFVEKDQAPSQSTPVQCQVEVELPFGLKMRFYSVNDNQ